MDYSRSYGWVVKKLIGRNRGYRQMKELLRSNDAVLISFVSALLEEARVGFEVADQNMSVLEGSIGALPRRVLVEEDQLSRARRILTEAGIGHALAEDDQV
jgi:hypothetical protein